MRDRTQDECGPVCDPSEEGLVGSSVSGGGEIGRADRDRLVDGRFRTGRLAGLTMNSAIWVLSWPVVLESFLNALVGLTDTVLAARLGTAETDAIGGAAYINWFIGLVIMAVGTGATALISRGIGAGRMALANAALGQSLIMAVVIGIAVGASIAASAGTIAGLLNMNGAATEAFVSYMMLFGAGVPFMSVMVILTSCARGAGDNRRPLYAMGVRNLVNIFASWALSGIDLFGIENPFSFDLGVVGIALGTVIGDIAAAGILLAMAWRGVWGIRVLKRRLVPHVTTTWRLVRLAFPNFVESFGMWFGNFVVITMVGMLGLAARDQIEGAEDGLLGAHIIAIRIESLSFLPGFAMGMAGATLAGQYIGAGRRDLAKAAVLKCAVIGAVVMGLAGAVFVLVPDFVVRLMSDQELHREITPQLVFACGTIQIPFALGLVFRTAMRGAGDVRMALALTWISTYALRLPMAYLFSGVDLDFSSYGLDVVIENPMPDDFFLQGITGLWVGLCADLALRGAMFTARFIHGGWTRQKV